MNFLGIDVGGTYIKAGISDEYGKVFSKLEIPTEVEKGLHCMIENIVSASEGLISKALNYGEGICGIGIGVPGPVDERGRVIKCVNLNWPIVPIADILRERLNLPTFAGNDGNTAAMGEYEAGALKGFESGVVLTLGTGIGGGVILSGKCRLGFQNIGGEIGHMIVGENFYDCNCGRNGCLETFSSATALIAYSRKLLAEGGQSSLRDILNGDFEKLDGKTIMEEAKGGDELCLKAAERAAKYLGIAIMNISAVIDPECVVIGGGMSKTGEWFIEKIRNEAKEHRYFKDFPTPKILMAKFGNDAGIVGAAMLAKNML